LPKSKIWLEIESLVKNGKLGKSRKFTQQLVFGSKMESSVKNRKFGQKSKFWSKIEILVKNRNFGPKSKICLKWKFVSKIKILVINIRKICAENMYHIFVGSIRCPRNSATWCLLILNLYVSNAYLTLNIYF